MRSKHNLPTAMLAMAAVMLLLIPSIARAIVYGFVDTNNVFTNTGAFIVKSPTTRSSSSRRPPATSFPSVRER